MNPPRLSVILAVRNPHLGRLNQVLAALGQQSIKADDWELCIVDNASHPPLTLTSTSLPSHTQILLEAKPGLFWARLAGIRATSGAAILFLDDDTVPASGTLDAAVDLLQRHPDVGVAGARIQLQYECTPPSWIHSVSWALASRDFGPVELIWKREDSPDLPPWSPIGAGLVVRREALPAYLRHCDLNSHEILRRSWKGQGVGGTEDKDLLLCLLRSGWAMAHHHEIQLTHLIPAERLKFSYFEKLLPELGILWVKTLHAHGMLHSASIHPATLLARELKAGWVLRAWKNMDQRLRWLSMCGHLRGLAKIHGDTFHYPVALPKKN